MFSYEEGDPVPPDETLEIAETGEYEADDLVLCRKKDTKLVLVRYPAWSLYGSA